jgi:hypothetical protein
MKLGSNIGVIILISLFLSACSPSQIFSNLTQSKEEAAAGETIALAERDAKRHAELESKRKHYQLSTPLLPPTGMKGVTGLVYAYMNLSKTGTTIEVDGYLPSPEHDFYRVWLTDENQSAFTHIGTLTKAEEDSVSLLLTEQGDFSDTLIMIIGDEASVSAKPTNPVLAGKLIETNVKNNSDNE